MTLLNKSLIAALSALFFMAASPVTNAAENPFGMTGKADQMQMSDSHEGMENMEGKCGEGKKKAEQKAKCSAGKCGEGKCDQGKSKEKEEKKGKCGSSE